MTVGELFASNGLQPCGPVAWGIPVQCDLPGVYVVALNSDPAWQSGLPVPEELPAEMRRRWLDDQPILYIGKAGGPGYKSVLGKRLGQFYRHCYGRRSPHSGGQSVKLLTLPLWVFWAATENVPREVEQKMLRAFTERAGHRPFANGIS
jgi:hypothetical protein